MKIEEHEIDVNKIIDVAKAAGEKFWKFIIRNHLIVN